MRNKKITAIILALVMVVTCSLTGFAFTDLAEGKYDADFIKCVAFGNNAALINNYFDKGSGIIVEGQLRSGSYEKDNEKVYTTEIIVERIEFVDKKEKEPEKENELPF